MTPHGSGPPLPPNKYRPIAELGRGGMATVFLAVVQGPAGFNKLQVIKRLRPALAADPEFLQMFLEEARLAARINHPNVVQTNEVGFDGQYYFIGMEYLDGQTLESINRKLRKAGKELPLAMHLYVLAETLAGLQFAHELVDFDGTKLNVVHRDVSPHNIMVGYDGHVKILDFGIAKAADSSNDTRTGIMKGKCAYMAPEQFGGMRVDRRADVFAAGVILWQSLTGVRLWKDLSDADIFAHLARGDIPTPRSVRPDVPEELQRICMRALGQRPEHRYASAAEMQTAIESYVAKANLRVNARDLGKRLSELFAENRTAIKAVIETQMSKGAADSVPRVSADPRSLSDVPALWALVPTSASDPSTPADAPQTETGNTSTKELLARQVTRERRRARVAIGGGIAIAVIAGVVLAASRRPIAAHAAAATPAAPATPSQTPEPMPTPTTSTRDTSPNLLRLTVRATPQTAHLFVDDAPLAGNPTTSTFTRDGAAHNVRAEAPGYVTKRSLAVFDANNVTIDLALDRERLPPPPVVRPAGGGGSGVGPSPAVVPTHETRRIDTGDPWVGSGSRP